MNTKRLTTLLTLMLAFTLLFSSCNLGINRPSKNTGVENTATEPVSADAGDTATDETAPAPEVFAALSEVSGEVLSRPSEDAEFAAAADGDGLAFNSQVQTLADSRARVDFEDGTLVRMAPETIFTLESVEDSDDGLIKHLIMQAGQIWIILSGGELTIDSDSGVASVRGSEISVFFDPITGEYWITCLSGTCTLSDGDTTIILGPGESASIKGPGAPPVGGQMTEEELQAWLDNNPEAALVMGSISNFVWADLNGNGLQDTGEPGLPEIEVNLYFVNAAGEIIALMSTFTNAAGFYSFGMLPGSSYVVKVIPPSGYIFTTPDVGTDDTIDSDVLIATGRTAPLTLGPGEDNDTIDAGLVEVQATGGGGICPLTGLPTDPALLALRPMGLSISKFPPEATRPPTGINWAPFVFEIFIGEGQTRLFSIFYCGYPKRIVSRNEYEPAANRLPAVGDLVWGDNNSDGLQDPLESGIHKVTVNLYTASQVKVATTTTDPQGFYIFENVAPGEYFMTYNSPITGVWTPANFGSDDNIDSDVNSLGRSDNFVVAAGDGYIGHIDAGLIGGSWEVTRIEGVRSGRVIYVDIGKHFNAGLIYQGADPRVEAVIGDMKCASASSTNPGDIGSGGIDIIRLQNIAAECQTANGNTDLDVYKFGPPPAGGQAAPQLWVFYNIYNQTKWIWDASLGGYVAWLNDIKEPEVFTINTDRLTSQPVVRQNVIVMLAPHNVINQAGTIINLDLDFTQGQAWLFRDGQAFNICWSTLNNDYPTESNRFRPILFTDCYGNIINLALGSTWVNVMDTTASVWDEGGGLWKARFYTPAYTP